MPHFDNNMSEHLWVRTPLVESAALSKAAGCRIFLKCENEQPSGSFKYRGTSHLMQNAFGHLKPGDKREVHFYCSSGGNAGIACATAAKKMGCEATVVVPITTSARLVKILKTLGAGVHQVGANWKEADSFLKSELLSKDVNGFYVPPFDDPIIWEGSSSLLGEVYEQMEAENGFDGVVCSVGGGSLLTGIMMAIHRENDNSTTTSTPPKVLAVETKGAESLNKSLIAGEHITLPKITSIATSLGIVRIASRAYELAQEGNVTSIVLSDAEAAMGCVRLADDEDILVEISCGVGIAAVYNGALRESLGKGIGDDAWGKMKIVIALCGGSDVSTSLIEEYRDKYAEEALSMKARTYMVDSSEELKSGVIVEHSEIVSPDADHVVISA